MTDTACKLYSGENCKDYPHCSCMGVKREYIFQDSPLCCDCNVPEYCTDFGCLREETDMNSPVARCNDCNTPDTCNRGGCVNEPVCCGDPNDCTEDCANRQDEVGTIDDRNVSPTNRFGCSYIDCDCTSPCYNEVTELPPDQKNVYITINGDMYGDIKV